jgi:glycosyltransferase involved in cell wall biosynthesis
VDDACPDGSGKLVEAQCEDARVRVIFRKRNGGVGAAVKSGYEAASADGFQIAVKIDGDGQMNPALIPLFVAPIAEGKCDYTKGNRFFFIEDVGKMPKARIFGNALLSLMAKLSTGYWNIFDPANGYTAIYLPVLKILQIDKADDRYFFETDILFRLNTVRGVVQDIPMRAIYANEQSGLHMRDVFFPFLWGNCKNFVKRIFYNYYLRDFQLASIEFVIGPAMLLCGIWFSLYNWSLSLSTDTAATAGTVMLGGLQIILGVQFTLSAISSDIRNIPSIPVQKYIGNIPNE